MYSPDERTLKYAACCSGARIISSVSNYIQLEVSTISQVQTQKVWILKNARQLIYYISSNLNFMKKCYEF